MIGAAFRAWTYGRGLALITVAGALLRVLLAARQGLGFDEDVLIEAGIRSTDVFAAVTDLDNTNLMAAEVGMAVRTPDTLAS